MQQRSLLVALALAAGVLAAPAASPAQDAPKDDGGGLFEGDGALPEPLSEKELAAAKELYEDAKDALGRGKFGTARKNFQQLLKDYPGADPAWIREAEDRAGDNCLVSIELQHEGGPPERRIDIELMGDGYTTKRYRAFQKDAVNQMKEFWAEPLYGEYADYFNVWRFNLISAEEGVDEMTMEERMGLPPKEEDNPRKKKRGPKKYSTALDCKAMGGGGQVWANPDQVRRWRQYFKHSDQLTIAFARKGQLGMGGGGIATTGKRVAVVHEFGHAFVGLLDEYAVNPNPPGNFFRPAPNSAPSAPDDPKGEPDLDVVPWRHWIEARHPEVGLFLGGATFKVGRFRPAASCAMNSGGSAKMCPVCRESGVLKIYSYLGPIDLAGPIETDIRLLGDETREFWVQPMTPKRHSIEVEWYLERVADVATGADDDPEPPAWGTSFVADGDMPGFFMGIGPRETDRRANPLEGDLPDGVRLDVRKFRAEGATRFAPVLPEFEPGTWRLTARAWDDAVVPGDRFPWVLKDPLRLLEERRTWTLVVEAPVTEPTDDTPEDTPDDTRGDSREPGSR